MSPPVISNQRGFGAAGAAPCFEGSSVHSSELGAAGAGIVGDGGDGLGLRFAPALHDVGAQPGFSFWHELRSPFAQRPDATTLCRHLAVEM